MMINRTTILLLLVSATMPTFAGGLEAEMRSRPIVNPT